MDRLRRAQVFGDDPETYDTTRPSYPSGVFDIALADAPASVVEVGCGTGKASVDLLARGVQVLGIEPDARMAAVARRNGVDVVVSRFEDWSPRPADAIVSAQAWHWVDPVLGAHKAADVLAPGGRWTACWNRERDERIVAGLLTAYTEHAPSLADDLRDQAYDDGLINAVTSGFSAAGGFGPIELHRVHWRDDVTVAHLIDRMSTHSSHRLLEPDVAHRVHQALSDALGGAERRLDLDYTTMVLTTTRC